MELNLPVDWRSSTLGAEADVLTGFPFPSLGYSASGIRLVRGSNVKRNRLDWDESITQYWPCIDSEVARYQLRGDDMVIAMDGALVGRSYATVSENDLPCLLLQRVARLRSSRIDQGLIRAWIGDASFERHVDSVKTQTAIPHISPSDIRSFPIVVSNNRDEQRAIAEVLGDVDALIGALEKLIAKKRDLKQAVMQQLLTGRTRLPGFSEQWEAQTIEQLEKRQLVRLSRGKVISKKDIERTPGDFPIYSSSVKSNGLFGRYGDHMFDEELISWSVDGGGHFFHRPKHKFSVTNVCGFMRVEPSKLNCSFLAMQLQHLHGKMKFDYQDKAHPSVIRKAYEVSILPMPEQSAIATVLSDMDTELAALEARRDKTRSLKQGMMQELLTGRIRLV